MRIKLYSTADKAAKDTINMTGLSQTENLETPNCKGRMSDISKKFYVTFILGKQII